jgi:hypothetical protein
MSASDTAQLATSLQFDLDDRPDLPPVLPPDTSHDDERLMHPVEEDDAARFESIIVQEVAAAEELTHITSAGNRLLGNLGKDTRSAIDLELAQAYADEEKKASTDDDKYAAELDAALAEHCRGMTSTAVAAGLGSVE